MSRRPRRAVAQRGGSTTTLCDTGVSPGGQGMLGLFPNVETALYLTAVVLMLFQAAGVLVMLVYSQGRRATA